MQFYGIDNLIFVLKVPLNQPMQRHIWL